MENLCKKWVKISKSKGLSPISVPMLYSWSSLNQHPEIFSRINGAVFVNLEALDALLEAQIQKPTAELTNSQIKLINARLDALEIKPGFRRKRKAV